MKSNVYTLYIFVILGYISCEKKVQKPLIIEHPNDAYGLSLQRVTLRCLASGEPTPTIEWYKGGKIVESYKDKPVTSNRHVKGNELLFLHLDTQDEGIYHCNASNSQGWVMSNNASVRIAYLHKNIGGPEARVASVGETVSLECRPPRGVPEPRILWRFNGRLLEPNKRIKEMPNGDLRIDKASRSDSGRYSCVAKNFAYERESEAATLTVRQKPQFRVAPSNIEVRVNEAAVLACVVDGDPKPGIVWRRDNDKHIASSRATLLEDRGLRIGRVQLSDSGNYVCQASNSAGTIEAVARLTVISAPGFLETPENQEARVGDTVKFVCHISGSPRPTVIWVHNGRNFIADEDGDERVRGANVGEREARNGGRMARMSERLANVGESRHKRETNIGEIGIKRDANIDEFKNERKVNIDKLGRKRKMKRGESRREVNIGEFLSEREANRDESRMERMTNIDKREVRISQLVLNIGESRRKREANIVESRNERVMNNIGGERVRANKDGSLVISSVQVSDAGKYECRASSYTGTIQSSALLSVLDSRHDIPPIIDIGPQNQTLRIGLTATFNCQSQSTEDVNIVWLKDSQRLNANGDPRVIQLTSGTLKINVLRVSDSGNYTCRLERGQAYSTWSVILRVLDKNDAETSIIQTTDDTRLLPVTPSNIDVRERGDAWITVHWDMPIHDPSDPISINHFVVQYSPYESRHGWSHTMSFTKSPAKITNLRPNTGYRLLVRAVNDLAIGRPAVVPFVVFTAKKQTYSQLSYNELKSKVENVFCETVRMRSVSRDQVTVVWQVIGPPLALRLLSGFLALYKRVPLSRCLANQRDTFMEHCSLGDHLMTQVEADMNNPRSLFNEEGIEHTKVIPISDWSDRTAAYTIITGLTPFVCYELYVRPYVDHPKYGRLTGSHSKAKTVLTYDSVPSKSPSDLSARWLTNTSVEISWRPVPPKYTNGILKGYSLHIIGNDTNSTRSIEVSPKSTVVRVQDLILHMRYIVHIAASTCQGEGIRSAGLVLTASANIITMSPNIFGARSGIETEKNQQLSVAKQPWFISIMVVGGCLWIMICVFIVVVCRGIYLRGLIYKSGYSNGTKLITSSNSQIQSGASNARLLSGHSNTYNESNSTGLYKDTLILQPLMGTTNSGTVIESKVDMGDTVTNSTTANNQRRFQDSISSNSTTSKNSANQQRTINNATMSSNNVAPYASASLLQQVIGISTKNNIKNYNYPINNSVTHRNILMPFSDSNLTSINQDMCNSQSYPLTAMDWAVSSMLNKSDKVGAGGIMLNLGHVIPPPPEFPPPPAPISPSASNSTYYLQQDPTADDGTCSYASCPIDVPISCASTTLSPAPGYLWSAKHNGLVPVPGYIDYACIPYNMISLARNSDTGSIASSFALPPPHDMLSMTQFFDDPYCSGSNGTGTIHMGMNGMTNNNDVLSSMMSSHMSNGSNMTVPCGPGSVGSAIMSGGSSRDYNKYDVVSRSGHNDDSNSALDEEDEDDDDGDDEEDDGNDDKSEDECEQDEQESIRCHKSSNSDPAMITGWQSPLTTHCSSYLPRASPYFSQTHFHPSIEEGTYDTCPDEEQSLFGGQNYFPHNKDFFPAPPPPNAGYYPSTPFNDHMNVGYDNSSSNGNPLNPFIGCGYLGETPIV